jgi:hypothetical protein
VLSKLLMNDAGVGATQRSCTAAMDMNRGAFNQRGHPRPQGRRNEETRPDGHMHAPVRLQNQASGEGAAAEGRQEYTPQGQGQGNREIQGIGQGRYDMRLTVHILVMNKDLHICIRLFLCKLQSNRATSSPVVRWKKAGTRLQNNNSMTEI